MLSPPFVSVFPCFWCLKPPFQAFQCISWFVLRRNTSFASKFPAVSGDSTKLWAPFPRHWRQSHLHIGGRLPQKDPKSDSVILPWRTRYGFYIIYCIINHHGIMVDISIWFNNIGLIGIIIIYIIGLIGIIMGLIWLTMVFGRYIMIYL